MGKLNKILNYWMIVESLKIENFRCFKEEEIFFDKYNCFVGANGAGKSTILCALNIFFRHSKDTKIDVNNISMDDFHHKNIEDDIRITVTFTDLSDKAKEELSDYVRHDKLIITTEAKFNKETGEVEVKQYGNRLGFNDFRKYFEKFKENASADELKDIYGKLKEKYNDLPNVKTKVRMKDALQEYESQREDKCIVIKSEDHFYGFTRVSKLAPFVQWVFIPASKDFIEESEESRYSSLGVLLERTIRGRVNFYENIKEMMNDVTEKYNKMVDDHQAVLKDISEKLQKRLAKWYKPNIQALLEWKRDVERAISIDEPHAFLKIKERGFESELTRFGHGLQRSYMLALLEEISTLDVENSPTLIMGIEEPEIYQHPPQIRYLAETLIDLAEKDSQILVCTHSPLFIPGDDFEKIRIVKENGDPSFTTIKYLKYEELAEELAKIDDKPVKSSGIVAKMYPSLNPIINEMYFCKILILVEGEADLAYLTSYLILTEKLNYFRELGCHIVYTNGKNRLIKPLIIARLLEIPCFVIFDGDTDKTSESEIAKHREDNKNILKIQGHENEDEWPTENIYKDNLVCWKENIEKTIQVELGENFDIYKREAFKFYDNVGDLKKNPLAIAKMLDIAWDKGVRSKTLSDLVERILKFALN